MPEEERLHVVDTLGLVDCIGTPKMFDDEGFVMVCEDCVVQVTEPGWKWFVDYAIRNLLVMDEEETRLFESKEEMEEFLDGFVDDGVEYEDILRIKGKLEQLGAGTETYQEHDQLCNEVQEILKKYMTHRELFEEDDTAWEEAFWRAHGCGDMYEEEEE